MHLNFYIKALFFINKLIYNIINKYNINFNIKISLNRYNKELVMNYPQKYNTWSFH